MFPDLFCDDVFTLETPRLFLRWPKAKDAELMTAFLAEKTVSEMTRSIPHPYPREEATRFILKTRADNVSGSRLSLVIAPRNKPDQLIGGIGITLESTGIVEIGYWLGVPFWGQGYATEAAQTLIDATFLYSETDVIHAWTRVMNNASRKVLEKCDFAQVGRSTCIRPAWGDDIPADCYRLSRAVWTSARSSKLPVLNRLQRAESTHHEIS